MNNSLEICLESSFISDNQIYDIDFSILVQD